MLILFIVQVCLLLMVCGLAVYFDLKGKFIPNWLTLPAATGGLLLPLFFGGLDGFLLSFFGLLFAFFVGGALWVLGIWGGGDHKLFLSVGSFLGVSHVGLALVIIALCGGVQALVYLKLKKNTMPYSISILSGVVGYALYWYVTQ